MIEALRRLARSMGVATHYRDGLGRQVTVGAETLIAVCASMGAAIEKMADAESALHDQLAKKAGASPPTLVAWDGVIRPADLGSRRVAGPLELTLEDGTTLASEPGEPARAIREPLPSGYHQLRTGEGSDAVTQTVIVAPLQSWRSASAARSWGINAHLAALRSSRSRSVGDLADLRRTASWVGAHGGDLVSVLPLLPTFNDHPAEPSPYSPVSRLFWSELVLDLGAGSDPVPPDEFLSVERADAEVRAALSGAASPDPSTTDQELIRYARFRAAQKRLGRDWRTWPTVARDGRLADEHVDRDEERHQLVAQLATRRQLEETAAALRRAEVRLGLDLAVGVHPEGYDAWSRPDLFAGAISVGAPPDGGFPSGQSWGFPPLLPDRSGLDGHAYFAASVAHQASVASVLRIDHIMAMHRLYWIPESMNLAEGTYVSYPSDELFAVLSLESHRNECELIGENLGTVPSAIEEALPRHRIWGMHVSELSATPTGPPDEPRADEVAMIGTHDTPTFAGWLAGLDIDERVRLGLLAEAVAPRARAERDQAIRMFAADLGGRVTNPEDLLDRTLMALGESPSPLVVLWLEDLWLEARPVNVPGSSSADRPNWQRAMTKLLDEALEDPRVNARVDALNAARARQPGSRDDDR